MYFLLSGKYIRNVISIIIVLQLQKTVFLKVTVTSDLQIWINSSLGSIWLLYQIGKKKSPHSILDIPCSQSRFLLYLFAAGNMWLNVKTRSESSACFGEKNCVGFNWNFKCKWELRSNLFHIKLFIPWAYHYVKLEAKCPLTAQVPAVILAFIYSLGHVDTS